MAASAAAATTALRGLARAALRPQPATRRFLAAGAATRVSATRHINTWRSTLFGKDADKTEDAAAAAGGEAGAAGAAPPVDEKDKKIKELGELLAEYKDKNLRLLAEAENVRNRARVDVKNAQEFGIQKFAKDLVQVADILQMALQSTPVPKEGDVALKSMYEGIEGTQAVLLKVFAQHGLKPMEPLGEKFDPNKHEAQFEVDDATKEPRTVMAVIRRGYSLNDRVVRAPQVGVVKARA